MTKNMILGTDWWTDCDDVVALRLIGRFIKEGQVNLLGIGINACMDYSAASLKSFLDVEGLSGIPVGIDLKATDFEGVPRYQEPLAKRYRCTLKNEDLPSAVSLYRRLLADSLDEVEIMEIGFPQVLSELLESKSDDISVLSGLELVKKKVSKIWVMAGKWDEDGGREHNFCISPRARTAAEKLCRLCPVPITFLGFEIGYDVITGDNLDESDPLHLVMADHRSGNGRFSWDPMLVLLAVIGDEDAAGYDTVTGFASVDADTGANHFRVDKNGLHKYVIRKFESSYYKNAINEIIKSINGGN